MVEGLHSLFRSRGPLVWCGGALLCAAACVTEQPREYYAESGEGASPGRGGTASGGSGAAPNQGGSDGQGASGGAPASDGSGGAPAPAPDGEGGAGGEAGSGNPVEPFDCGPAPVADGPFTREALRAAAADCAMWQYCRFEGTAEELSGAVQAHEQQASEASLEQAREAWVTAMELWSELELFQFGPLGSRSEAAGRDPYHGEGIRDLIYSWPAVGRCKVEDQVIGQRYRSSWASVVISARGLFGLEYLLFYPGADTACAASTTTAKQWAELDPAEIEARKREYAAALATDISERARSLVQAWAPEGGNFREKLVEAAGYPSEQEALNVLAWSLVYVEKEVKDWKLGVPAGYTATHPVTLAETPYARLGTQAIRGNLRGFRALFQGCGDGGAGLGFDDWLEEAGHGDLARDMIAALDGAQAAADSFPAFEDATPAELDSLYWSVKALTNLLKTDLFGAGSPLNLKLPAGVEGDTD